MTAVIIGVDPHKRSNTALVLDSQERVLARQRFDNDRAGYRQLKRFAASWRDRRWAVEGARGAGLGLAQRLAADGETVLNVPAKLSARVRVLGGGSGRKTDDSDAYAIAVAGLRGSDLQPVTAEDNVTVLKMLSDRRRQLVAERITTVNRLHQLLAELVPGGAHRNLSATQARQVLRATRPRQTVAQARKQLALDHLDDLTTLEGKIKAMTARIEALLTTMPSTLSHIRGIGTVTTALILGEVADVRRFPNKHHFASYTGTAPIDASSGDHTRQRLNRGGNRRLNYALHIAALTQIRTPGPGRDYYQRKRAAGKTPLEAMRCLKRRLSDVVYQTLLTDLRQQPAKAGPEGHSGATLESSASDPTPTVSPSDQSQPGPATTNATAHHSPTEPTT